MRNLILLAGTAALALAAPASAEKGGHGRGGGKPAKVERGGGHQARATKPAKAERHGFRAELPARAQRQAFSAERPERAQRRTIRDERRHDVFVGRAGEDRRDFRRIGRDVRRSPESAPLRRRRPLPPGAERLASNGIVHDVDGVLGGK